MTAECLHWLAESRSGPTEILAIVAALEAGIIAALAMLLAAAYRALKQVATATLTSDGGDEMSRELGETHGYHCNAKDRRGNAIALTPERVAYSVTPADAATLSPAKPDGGVDVTFTALGTVVLGCRVDDKVDVTPLSIDCVPAGVASGDISEDPDAPPVS